MENLKEMVKSLNNFKNPKLYLCEICNFDLLKKNIEKDDLDEFLFILNQKFSDFALNNGFEFFCIDNEKFALIGDRDFDISKINVEIEKIDNFLLKNNKISIDKNTIILDFKVGISFEKNHYYEYASRALQLAKFQNRRILTYCEFIDSNLDDMQIYMAGLIADSIEKNCLFPFFQAVINNKKEIEFYDVYARIITKSGIYSASYFMDAVYKYGLDCILNTKIYQKSQKFKEKFVLCGVGLEVLNLKENGNFMFKFNVQNLNDTKVNFMKSLPRKNVILTNILNENDLKFVDFAKYVRINEKTKLNDIENLLKIVAQNDALSIAQGIETKENYEFCKDLGFDFFSGFYIQNPCNIPNSVLNFK